MTDEHKTRTNQKERASYRTEAVELVKDVVGVSPTTRDFVATVVDDKSAADQAEIREVAEPTVQASIKRARTHMENSGAMDDLRRKVAKYHAVELAKENNWPIDEIRVCVLCGDTVLVRDGNHPFCTCEAHGPPMVTIEDRTVDAGVEEGYDDA